MSLRDTLSEWTIRGRFGPAPALGETARRIGEAIPEEARDPVRQAATDEALPTRVAVEGITRAPGAAEAVSRTPGGQAINISIDRSDDAVAAASERIPSMPELPNFRLLGAFLAVVVFLYALGQAITLGVDV